MFVNGIKVEEYAKLEYGRLPWRVPAYRERLLRHWKDSRRPHAQRFGEAFGNSLGEWYFLLAGEGTFSE